MTSPLKSRFHSLSFVLLAACVVGTPYAFGIFSLIFRHELGYNQLDLSIVSSCGSTGLYTGVINGLAIERFGPAKVLKCGAVLIFVGNMYVWMAVKQLVWHGVGPVASAYFIAQMGTAAATNVALVVAIRNFPASVTGQTAGLAKGYFGASSAVLATVAACFFHLPSTGFVLFVALALPLVLIIASVNINFLPEHMVPFSHEEARGCTTSLSPYMHHLCLVFAFILSIGATQHFFVLSRPVSVASGCALCLLVLSVLALPSMNKGSGSVALPGAQYKEMNGSSGSEPELEAATHPTSCDEDDAQQYCRVSVTSPVDSVFIELGDYSSPVESSYDESDRKQVIDTLYSAFSYSECDDSDDDEEVELVLNGDSVTDLCHRQEVFVSFYGRHLPLRESLRTWRLYCIMVVFCVVAGSGILVINNIQAVAGAVGKQPSEFFVTTISLANAGGRVIIGSLADSTSHLLSRFQLLALVAVCMAVTQFLLSFGSPLLLYPCFLMTGAMFGATFSNIAAITADVFGSKYVGSTYGFIDLAPAVGSYIFSAGLVSLFYPHHDTGSEDTDNDIDSGDHYCRGAHCFQRAFVVTTSFCLLGALLSVFLHLTTPMNRR